MRALRAPRADQRWTCRSRPTTSASNYCLMKGSTPVPPTPTADPPRQPRRSRSSLAGLLTAVLVTAWTAITVSAMLAAGRPPGGLLARLTVGVRHRIAALRASRDSGLTTVEVAIITAVLLGLATALVVAITVVVNRNTAKIK